MSASRTGLAGVQKIQRGPLREQVRVQIKQLILTNRLRPGQSLVIDRLASELGVSHTPVREALAMLQHDGLVLTRLYGNPQVAEIGESDVRDAWEMRLLLEGWAVRHAIHNLPDYELDHLEDLLVRAQRHAQQARYEAHIESDVAFHGMIVHAPENKLFDRLAQLVSDQSFRIRSLFEAIAPVEEVQLIIDEHFGLLQALRIRDADLAHDRLLAHLRAGMQRTLIALDKMREEEQEEE